MPTAPAGKYPSHGLSIAGDCDTIMVESCEIGDCIGVGVIFEDGQESGPRLIRLNDVYVERAAVGFTVLGGRDIRMSGCHAALNNGPGFVVGLGESVSVINCQAVLNGAHGFFVSGSGPTIIGNCTASYNSENVTETGCGCFLDPSAANVQVTGNRFGDCVYFSLKRQRYGLSIEPGAAKVIATSNNTLDNGIAGINGTAGPNVILANNL